MNSVTRPFTWNELVKRKPAPLINFSSTSAITWIVYFWQKITRRLDVDDMTYAYVLLIGVTLGALVMSAVGHLLARD